MSRAETGKITCVQLPRCVRLSPGGACINSSSRCWLLKMGLSIGSWLADQRSQACRYFAPAVESTCPSLAPSHAGASRSGARKPKSESRACLFVRGDRNIAAVGFYNQFGDVKTQAQVCSLLRRILSVLAADPGLKIDLCVSGRASPANLIMGIETGALGLARGDKGATAVENWSFRR
jgi:hypothetical protein